MRDRRGATLVEFALIVPVMLALIMGLCELAFQVYVQAILVGAMQKAGRDSTIQTNATQASNEALDRQVAATVRTLVSKATYATTRKSYSQYGTVLGEPFQDNNKNGIYDSATECFTDTNNNKIWDADPSKTGQGGAGDVVVYRMDITYPRLFPVAKLIGLSQTVQLSATTILKNQPYRDRTVYTSTQVCPT
jgi:Flp pilus assembly pilin Flp